MEKIGDFARRCQVAIKTLRYYDKLGLLRPDYIDNFTGYRYYGQAKVAEMCRITELKEIGFTLEEIKRFCSTESSSEKSRIIDEKRRELEKLADDTERQLSRLAEIGQSLYSSAPNTQNKIKEGENPMSKIRELFENDENVIGRWEIIATVAKKEEFVPIKDYGNDSFFEEIYFLPDGQPYWGFSWTKGYLKIHFGDCMLCLYELSEIDGETYMFIEYQNEFDRNPVWVLKQSDNKRYTVAEISQYDNLDLPFIDDPRVLGYWVCEDFVPEIEKFEPDNENRYWNETLYLKSVTFMPDGFVRKSFVNSGSLFNDRWTNGVVLSASGDGPTAEAYEIREYGGTEYLFLEWKNGDYIWGKRKPFYYVLRRDESKDGEMEGQSLLFVGAALSGEGKLGEAIATLQRISPDNAGQNAFLQALDGIECLTRFSEYEKKEYRICPSHAFVSLITENDGVLTYGECSGHNFLIPYRWGSRFEENRIFGTKVLRYLQDITLRVYDPKWIPGYTEVRTISNETTARLSVDYVGLTKVKAGVFDGCIKVTVTAERNDWGANYYFDNFNFVDHGTKEYWFAPGVGIIKFDCTWGGVLKSSLELISYTITPGNGSEHRMFPINTGNRWEYDEINLTEEGYTAKRLCHITGDSDSGYSLTDIQEFLYNGTEEEYEVFKLNLPVDRLP